MKIFIYFFLILSGLYAGQAIAQDETAEAMYRAYLSKDAQPEAWKKAVRIRKAAVDNAPSNTALVVDLAMAQYGLLNSTMRTKDEELFDAYYDETESLLKNLMDKNNKDGEPMAILSAIYGLKISYSSMLSMFLGPKSGHLIEKAKKLSPKSPLVLKMYANSKFFTPEMWGGDLKEAIESYEKCIQLYEGKPDQLAFNWMYLDALAHLGKAYLKNGERDKAILIYQKALNVQPEFSWVKNVLLPKAYAAKENSNSN